MNATASNTFTTFDHLFDAVLVVNAKREIVYFNHQANIFFKLPPRLMKQKNFVTEICGSTDLDLEKWIEKSIHLPDVLISSELSLSIPHELEPQHHVVIKCIPLTGPEGPHFALLFHDLTVEKNLHLKYRDQVEELKKTHTQILQADKLKTLGEITATISHEINNPLTIAAGHCEIIGDMLKLPNLEARVGRLQSANQTVYESIERVNQIIKNMKDFLHQSEDEKVYCDLGDLADAAIDWIRPAAQRVPVKITRNAEAWSVALANKIKLEQVVINLIKNSIDAISEAGTDNGEVQINIFKSEADHQTFIDIVDNGPGLSLEMKLNLFKPFQSTKDAGNGTGLGLSICQKIIESHKGRLEHIDSPSGCHFRIKIPMIEAYSYTRNDKSLLGANSKQKILVLDNEVQILNVLNNFIQDEGFVFIGSSDPQGSLNFLEKANIDLILTDILMPQMDGGQFASKARELGYSGPILYMTGSKNVDQYNKDQVANNLSGLIVKPFSKDDVIKTIRGALKTQEGAE